MEAQRAASPWPALPGGDRAGEALGRQGRGGGAAGHPGGVVQEAELGAQEKAGEGWMEEGTWFFAPSSPAEPPRFPAWYLTCCLCLCQRARALLGQELPACPEMSMLTASLGIGDNTGHTSTSLLGPDEHRA